MNKWLLIFGLIVIYLVIINFAFSLNFSFDNGNLTIPNESAYGGAMVNIGVGEQVSIFVTRHRFYGVIEESDGKSMLYLFNLIPIPLIRNNFNFLYFHIPFLALITFLLFKREKVKGGKEEIWEEPNGGNYL